MSSKRRLRRNQCGKKKKYATDQEARQAIYRLSQSSGPIGFMNAYKCSFCSSYHIGHATNSHQRARP